MVKQYKVVLMSIRDGIREHIVNCTDSTSARHIATAIFPTMGVIDIVEND